MVAVMSLNVNAFKKGDSGDKAAFFALVGEERPDIVCLQDTGRAHAAFPAYARPVGYGLVSSFEAGSSGVAILSRRAGTLKDSICDHELCRGRFVEMSWPDLRVASVFVPSPGNALKNKSRTQFLECLQAYMIENADRPCIIAGDFNITLSNGDTYDEQKTTNSAWMDLDTRAVLEKAITQYGWIDTFRSVNGADIQRATVWHRESAFPDHGFGVDFLLVSAPLKDAIVDSAVLKPESYATRYSDHAPVSARFALDVSSS
jgi:exodeoxyribonuclease-3